MNNLPLEEFNEAIELLMASSKNATDSQLTNYLEMAPMMKLYDVLIRAEIKARGLA